MGDFLKTMGAVFGGIGLLIFAGLILTNSSGTTSIISSVMSGTLSETKALQYR